MSHRIIPYHIVLKDVVGHWTWTIGTRLRSPKPHIQQTDTLRHTQIHADTLRHIHTHGKQESKCCSTSTPLLHCQLKLEWTIEIRRRSSLDATSGVMFVFVFMCDMTLGLCNHLAIHPLSTIHYPLSAIHYPLFSVLASLPSSRLMLQYFLFFFPVFTHMELCVCQVCYF